MSLCKRCCNNAKNNSIIDYIMRRPRPLRPDLHRVAGPRRVRGQQTLPARQHPAEL